MSYSLSIIFGTLALLGSTLLGPNLAAAAERPNIVIFLSDDHGWFDGPVFGTDAIRTPNLVRIAADGVAFDRAFVGSPACVPSRAILMTGLMSVRNGAEANHSQIKPDVRTLSGYLKELGYKTVHFGKSHFQPRENYADMEEIPSRIKGNPPDVDVSAVTAWLSRRTETGPLCMVVCSHRPHVVWPEPDGYDPATIDLPPTFVDTPETRDSRARYATDVTVMDSQVGEVYDAVRKHLPQNTLFIYLGDHGSQFPFAKWTLYDAGIRTPMIAVWPGVLKPGTRSGALVGTVDSVPTFIELAGGTPPGDLDGQSFARVLRGETDRHRDELFATHSADGVKNIYPMRAVRTERFKYILNLHPEFKYTSHITENEMREGLMFWQSWERAAVKSLDAAAKVQRYQRRPKEELYDVEADPHEQSNLADRPSYQDELQRLRQKVQNWMREQGDEGKVFGEPKLRSAP